jgi:hypothetical protein
MRVLPMRQWPLPFRRHSKARSDGKVQGAKPLIHTHSTTMYGALEAE